MQSSKVGNCSLADCEKDASMMSLNCIGLICQRSKVRLKPNWMLLACRIHFGWIVKKDEVFFDEFCKNNYFLNRHQKPIVQLFTSLFVVVIATGLGWLTMAIGDWLNARLHLLLPLPWPGASESESFPAHRCLAYRLLWLMAVWAVSCSVALSRPFPMDLKQQNNIFRVSNAEALCPDNSA